MIDCYLSLSKPPLPREVRSYRCYKSIDIVELQHEIQNSSLFTNPASTLDAQLDQYNSILSDIINKLAPLKTRKVTIRPVTPWYSEEIHAAKIERRKAESRWRSQKLTIFFDIYKAARNKVTSLIAKAKTAYFSDKIKDCDTDQKALFRVVDEILGKQVKLNLPPHESLDELLPKFNHFFQSKIAKIRQCLDSDTHAVLVKPSSVLPVHDTVPNGSLNTFTPLTIDEVQKLVTNSPTKSCSLDPLPTWLLKKTLPTVLPSIARIVNSSLELYKFPSAMKTALVTPLLKKPTLDASLFKNYRPVSNLSFISKLTEKAVLKQFNNHLENNNLHVPVQSAYRSKHSTETALLKIQNDILLTLDSGKGVILVLLDLSAAFDTIDHGILVSRLQSRFGINNPALKWFQSYLEDRYQSIFLGGKTSAPTKLIYGVPQGSVFGPSDFTGYMGPVYDIVMLHTISMHQYADDTQLYLSFDITEQEAAITKMEACVDDIRIWMRENKLQLNDEKSELIIITPSRQSHKVTIDSIKIGNAIVKATPSAKNLGALFDKHMNLSDHITNLVRSCNFQLRCIGRARKYLTHEAAEKVIHAFISSRIDCGNSLIYNLPAYQIERVQRIQNTAARILTLTKKYDRISPILISLHWLPVEQRIKFKILTLTYKCLHNLAPKYLEELIKPYEPVRNLRSSDKLLLEVPKTRLKTFGDRSFSKAAPTLWNSLPLDIRSSDSLDSFKTQLKTYLKGAEGTSSF